MRPSALTSTTSDAFDTSIPSCASTASPTGQIDASVAGTPCFPRGTPIEQGADETAGAADRLESAVGHQTTQTKRTTVANEEIPVARERQPSGDRRRDRSEE